MHSAMNTRSSLGSCDMKHFAGSGMTRTEHFHPGKTHLGLRKGTSLRLYFVTRSPSVQFLEVTSFSGEKVPLCSASSSICQTGSRLSQRSASSQSPTSIATKGEDLTAFLSRKWLMEKSVRKTAASERHHGEKSLVFLSC